MPLKLITLFQQTQTYMMNREARPDFAELDVFLGQHILLTLKQHFIPNI